MSNEKPKTKPTIEVTPTATTKTALEKVIKRYKESNPVKFQLKKAELERKLASAK